MNKAKTEQALERTQQMLGELYAAVLEVDIEDFGQRQFLQHTMDRAKRVLDDPGRSP